MKCLPNSHETLLIKTKTDLVPKSENLFSRVVFIIWVVVICGEGFTSKSRQDPDQHTQCTFLWPGADQRRSETRSTQD